MPSTNEVDIKKILRDATQNECTLEPDSEEGPGDLYHITKYIDENKIQMQSSYGTPHSLEGQAKLKVYGEGFHYPALYGLEENKDEIIKMADKYIAKMLGNPYDCYGLAMGEHTLFPDSICKYTPSHRYTYSYRPMFKYKGDHRKKLPVVNVDVRVYYPEEFTDENGDMVFSLPNLRRYKRLLNADPNVGGWYTNLPSTRCNSCFNYSSLEDVRERDVKAFNRRGQYLYTVSKCSNCGEDAESSVVLTPPMQPPFSRVHHVIGHMRISKRYYVESRHNGGGPHPKLRMVGANSTNTFKWTHNNWAHAALKPVRDYAAQLDVPVEVVR